MRANACVMALGKIAVKAEDLQVGRESLPLDSSVEVPPYIVPPPPISCAIIIDMIQRQEGRTGFSAAGAFPSVMGQHFFLELLILPTPIMHSAPRSFAARAVTVILGADAAPDIWPSGGGRITESPPAHVVLVAPTPREEGIVTLVDCTNLVHFRSHFIIAYTYWEIKSWL